MIQLPLESIGSTSLTIIEMLEGFECLQINKTLELGKVTHLLPFPTLWDFGRKTKE